MSTIKQIIKKIENDPHFFPESSETETVNFLKSLIILTQPKNVLEIGTFIGYSTCAIAKGLTKKALLTTVDSKKYFHKYYKLLPNHIKQKIKIVNKESKNFLFNLDKKVKFDFIFIDASHDYVSVFSDFFLSLNHSEKESIYVFHDSMSPGVNRVLKCIKLANIFSAWKTANIITLPTPEKPEITTLKNKNKIPEQLSCISGIAVATLSKNILYPVFYFILLIIYHLNEIKLIKSK